MTQETDEAASNEPQTTAEKFDDDHYPAYTMGRAAELLGTSANFLRSLDEAKFIEPQRSTGGHRRYTRYQLRLAARVRALVDQGTGLDAACRIVTLEDQLHEAQAVNAEALNSQAPTAYPPLRGV